MAIPNSFTIIAKCQDCDGTGQKTVGAPPEQVYCNNCGGTGINAPFKYIDGLVDAFTYIDEKIQEVKTKINQMQADINYIKAKVG